MAVNDSILNKTKNYFRCVGTLSELNLKREETKIKLKDENGNETGTKAGERIMGSVAVKTDNGIHTFNVYAQNLTSKGEESKQWKMYTDMMNWNPAIGGDSSVEPTLVNIEGTVSINDYVNQQGEAKSSLRWRVGRANTKASPDEPKGVTLKATAFIDKIVPEIRQEEETGRLLVTLYGAENNGTCFPINCIVDEDMADDFNDCYEVGMTVPFEFEAVSRHVGGTVGGKKKFGHGGAVVVNSGFDVTELMLVGGDDEIEEPDELTTEDENGNEIEIKTEHISPVAMEKAKKARAQMLEELKKNPPAKKSSDGANALKEKKQAAKNKMKFGMKASHPVDDDTPSDFDDDDLF